MTSLPETTTQPELLDILYLDTVRLASFASQLQKGLQLSTVRKSSATESGNTATRTFLRPEVASSAEKAIQETIELLVHDDLLTRVLDQLSGELTNLNHNVRDSASNALQSGALAIATGGLIYEDYALLATELEGLTKSFGAFAKVSPTKGKAKEFAPISAMPELVRGIFGSLAHVGVTIPGEGTGSAIHVMGVVDHKHLRVDPPIAHRNFAAAHGAQFSMIGTVMRLGWGASPSPASDEVDATPELRAVGIDNIQPMREGIRMARSLLSALQSLPILGRPTEIVHVAPLVVYRRIALGGNRTPATDVSSAQPK
jgi:hypothetical protein